MVDEPKIELKLVASNDPADIFNDLAKLRKESTLVVKRKSVLTNVSVGTPPNTVHFRTSPDPERMLENATIIRHKDGSRDTIYFVTPAMRGHPKLAPRLRPVTLRLVSLWPGGNVMLWPVPHGTSFAAWRTAQRAAQLAETNWVQLTWNEERADYNLETAEHIKLEPVWPVEHLAQFLKVGFADCILDNENHEYVRLLRGLAE